MINATDQELHRLILEGLPLGIAVINRDAKIVLWSAGAEHATGFFRQEVLGRPSEGDFLQHLDSENNSLQGVSAPLTATLRDGRGLAGELSLRSKNGHFFPARVWTFPLRNDSGTLLGAVEVFEPVSAPASNDRRQSRLGAFGALDPLTGALNHSMIQAHLREHLSLHALYPVPFCAMCFAIDDLPKLRERYGQAAVEASLKAVAQTIENGLRPTDFLGRWLDHEFLAILTECGEAEIMKVGERLCRMVRHSGVTWWGDTLHVTVSVGGTVAHDNDTVGSIVSRTEDALRECSAAGGNRVVVISS